MLFSQARRFYGLESHLQGKVVTFGGGYALCATAY
ncbi:ATP/cobalamin adenosyltransferase [Salmonella enterica subsp. enterica]|uniref:ATP/cobalamin adenosyltransferase n=1 Tax=Salmonella enterica I TaxID=59201 RepID=A0A379WSI6_SALET|nr:ATP/cobalamin adenosyltransferase [Salmonella enterica subsp. enterica]